MAVVLTDRQMEVLIQERKALPVDFYRSGTLKPKRGHYERELSLTGAAGSEFLLILRQSKLNPLDFSVILGYQLPNATRVFRLRRYNGRSHEHSNKLENERFYDFHVHFATERYQQAGFSEDAYAEVTQRYSEYTAALDCLLLDCNCETPDAEPRLF